MFSRPIGPLNGLELDVPFQRIVSGPTNTVLQCAHHAPRDTESSAIETREGESQTLTLGKHVLLGDFDGVHKDRTGDGCSKCELVLDWWGSEAVHALVWRTGLAISQRTPEVCDIPFPR